MKAMFRRLLRIFCVVGLVVIVGMAVLTLFWGFAFWGPFGGFLEDQRGVHYFENRCEWQLVGGPLRHWEISDRLGMPSFISFLFLPWWFLILTWSLFTALIWFLTRRRKIGQGFPVEPTVKSK